MYLRDSRCTCSTPTWTSRPWSAWVTGSQPCQSLGVVGMSGNTDIPHLHIETRWGPPGQVFESMRFYDTRATVEEMDAYVQWRTSGVFQHFDPLYLLAPGVIPTATPEND